MPRCLVRAPLRTLEKELYYFLEAPIQMAYCPQCLTEYTQNSTTQCVDCQVSLQPGSPPYDAALGRDPIHEAEVELVKIRTFSGPTAALDAELVEYIGGSPYVDGLLEAPFALDAEGYLAIPSVPGLGVRLDREKVGRYSPDAAGLFATGGRGPGANRQTIDRGATRPAQTEMTLPTHYP